MRKTLSVVASLIVTVFLASAPAQAMSQDGGATIDTEIMVDEEAALLNEDGNTTIVELEEADEHEAAQDEIGGGQGLVPVADEGITEGNDEQEVHAVVDLDIELDGIPGTDGDETDAMAPNGVDEGKTPQPLDSGEEDAQSGALVVAASEEPGVVARGLSGTCTWVIYEGGELVIAPQDGEEGTLSSRPWSSDYADVITSVRCEGTVYVDTCYAMFYEYSSLVTADLRNMKYASRVTDQRVNSMFAFCDSLVTVDAPNLITSQITEAEKLFYCCKELRNVDTSSWDTSGLRTTADMFAGCSSLVSLDLNGWDTSRFHVCDGMFSGCSALTSLGISDWDVSNVTTMSSMFASCTSLETLDISSWDTSSVKNMANTFGARAKLRDLDISGWNTASATSMNGMFYGCSSLTSLDLSSWDVSRVSDCGSMFSQCTALSKLDITGWNTAWLDNTQSMFLNCAELSWFKVGENVDVSKICPDPFADQTLSWRSQADGQVYTKEEIASLRKGIADTYIAVEPVDIACAWIEAIPSQYYTGQGIEPRVVVSCDRGSLCQGVNYTVRYESNVDSGTATVFAEGTGHYTGTISATFEILPAELTVPTGVSHVYTGERQVGVESLDGCVLSGTVSAVNSGAYVAYATPDSNHCWSGGKVDTKPIRWAIGKRGIDEATVPKVASQTYTGSAIKPLPVVKIGGKTLKRGTDYTVSYADNVKAGTATIIVTGAGNYAGMKSVTFKINAKAISGATVSSVATQKWTGKAIKPTPTVKDGKKTLVRGTDFSLSYKNNTDPGTATITVRGKGNYKGTKSVTFKIGRKTGAWKQIGSHWRYLWSDGKYPKSQFADIDGARYYFDASGYMVTGWKKVGGKWYFFRSDGKMGANDWAKSGSKWCYLRADGSMATGWIVVSGQKYYMDSNGYMVTGWRQISGKYYYFESSGAMAKSKWVGNYYLQADGTMAADKWVGKYHFDITGKWDKTK